MSKGPADRIGQRIKHIIADLKRYVEKRIELMAVTIGEESGRWIANSVQKIAGFFLLFGALVFLLIALALYIGALLNSRSLGFLLVSIPLLIVGYLFINLKPRTIRAKLEAELEDELLSMLQDREEDDHTKLIESKTNNSTKDKEYDE